MDKATEFLKSVVRPLLIIWGFLVAGIILMQGGELPIEWLAIIGALAGEYGVERAILRLKK